MLFSSLQSRTPLTEVLLKNKCPPVVSQPLSSSSIYRAEPKEEELPDQGGKFCLKLMVSKSKKMVCYAEAKKDFVSLVLSFLSIPLGFMARKLYDADSFCGRIDVLYKSVEDLDGQFFKSNHKEMLVNPRLAFGFSDKNDILGIKAATNPAYYYSFYTYCPSFHSIYLTTDSEPFSENWSHPQATLFVMDNDTKIGEGFFRGLNTMFIVTDSLMITPISTIRGLSILNELKVPFSDIEEQVVHVGKEEVSLFYTSVNVSYLIPVQVPFVSFKDLSHPISFDYKLVIVPFSFNLFLFLLYAFLFRIH